MNDNYGVNAENIQTSVLIQKVEGGVTIGYKPENPPKPIDINWREVSQNALAERQKLTTNPFTTGDGLEFTFDDIYVPLGLVEKVKKEKRPGEVSPEEGSQLYQSEEVTRTYKNDEFFAQVLKQGQSPKSQGRRLAVTGEPGAGKTTLLQKIAQWVATETEQDVAIWVSLADLQGRNVEDYLLQKWLKDALGAVRVTPEMEEALALLFKSGRVWLLLDGVDEMGSSNPLATVANQISGWVASARVVVTCRQNVWDAGKNALEGFDVYRNLDFDYPEGVGQFIQRWFARHPELGERLLAELAQDGKERIRDTVRNPLRLALLCRAWQIRQGGLPETKAGLYGQFAEALYEWKQEAFPTKSKQRKDLNAGLGRLALRGMEQSESRFRLREALVTEILGETDEPLCQLALQLGWLNLVGVAVENPDARVYAFYHPTFQEYFAALAVNDWDYFLPRNHVDKPVDPPLIPPYQGGKQEAQEAPSYQAGKQQAPLIKGGWGDHYRIFEKQWKEVILLWFGRGDVQKEKKEAFIEKLVNFDDGCGDWNYPKVDRGFYEYRAYFFAGVIVPEFKDSRLADEIVSQIVKCVIFWEPIAAGENAVLIETDRVRAIARLIQLLDETSDDYTRRYVADSLGNIAVGNEGAIAQLIQLLNETSNENTRWSVANILGNIAVGNEGAIARLIQLLNETSDEDTRSIVANSLGNIAVGNEGAIARLIQLLNETSDENTRWSVANILGNIAVGNEGAINRLIQLLNETSSYYTRSSIVDSLGKIAEENEGAINRLIQLLNETSDEDTRRSVANSLGNIAVGNEGAIARLIQLLNETSDDYTRSIVANSLGNIAVGNEGAIARLIQLLNETSDDYTRRIVAESLGKIAEENEGAINRLIQLLNETSYEDTRSSIVDSLGNIAVGNEGAINRLIQLLNETSDEDTRRSVANILGNIAVGNEGAIARLIQLLNETSDDYTRLSVADSLGKIAVGNEGAIARLIQLLNETSYYYTCGYVAESLGNIAVGNEGAIARLIQLLNETSYYYTRGRVADSLGKILVTKQQYAQVIFRLKDNLTDKIYQRNYDLYEQSYKLIWQYAQNLSYSDFYEAWRSQPAIAPHPEAFDNIQINHILTQLQPTTQTYPLPINIQSLADETDTSAICQELCTLIYSLALPDPDIPTVSNFAQLKQQIFTVKKQLQKRHLALILHNCKPHPPLLTCCRKIADAKLGLHILWITDEPLEAPLRGFPPSQDILLGAIQTWLEKLC
ncbi:HEAT repeat domain-containing protein [Aerosakkonema funiforme]|uniref:HEAT repeat domain-containing protein n=1 Tax=Aerosakkonema funiforme FACHB-1375 TaxID=2949571 RepID=A0A926V9J8_9CYAN|nr:HEAT repeat domain-containing protein [Aerosakkonema funiforme]MBD2179605.1 HEAT repeat domain-containing protein [Aerosakkonema funiforme FACHB-1375]